MSSAKNNGGPALNNERTSQELQDKLISGYGNFLTTLGISGKQIAHAQGYLKHEIEKIKARAIKEALAEDKS